MVQQVTFAGTGILPDIVADPGDAEGDELVLDPVEMTSALPNHVDYYEEFELEWEFYSSLQPSMGWSAAGTTRNQMYVTLAIPDISPIYHSPIHLFCTSAIGADTEPDAISKAWTLFEGREIQTVKAETLHYYKDWSREGPNNMTAAQLLQNKDGTCYSWAAYFKMVLEDGGVKNTAIEAYRVEHSILGVNILIKNWTFVGNGTSNVNNYPYLNILSDLSKYPISIPGSILSLNGQGVWSYVWGNTVEMQDADGLPGQGTANPRSLFQHHIVVRIGGADYYDPSCGLKHASMAAWETASLAG